jgi:hypothetical protein
MYRFIFAFAFSLTIINEFPQSSQNSRLTKSIDSLVAPQFIGNRPGVLILIAKQGQIVYQNAFGSAGGQFISENGKVTGFIVQQNGRYEWKKIN